MNGYRRRSEKLQGSLFLEPNNFEAPKQVDWRTQGYVTPVKDQVRIVGANLYWVFKNYLNGLVLTVDVYFWRWMNKTEA